VYEGLGKRLSADGHPVYAVHSGPSLDLAGGPAPLVLIGSDTGARQALRLTEHADGLILAGLAARPPAVDRLDRDAEFTRGTDADPVPAGLAESEVPVLLLHGDADVIAPIGASGAFAGRLPRAEFVTVRGGRHDVLNDINHRSVAARIVLRLERLRAAPDLSPIVS
jgi:pimeloyl-ACP methyl ester carboxylesterase